MNKLKVWSVVLTAISILATLLSELVDDKLMEEEVNNRVNDILKSKHR